MQKDTGADDYSLAFDANTEEGMVKYVNIPRTLETVAEIDTCNAVFKLLCYYPTQNTYMPFDLLAAELVETLSADYLKTWISFNATSGDFEAEFYQDEIDIFRPIFNEGGIDAMKFMVIGTVPGSQLMGPTIPDTDKVVAEFKIIFIDNTVVETCADNVLSVAGKTYADPNGAQRANVLEYQVPTKENLPA